MKTKKTKIKESVVTPQNEVRGHTPTPWSVDCWGLDDLDWSIEDPNHKDIVRGLSQKDAEFIVRAANSHEALLEAAKESLFWLESQQHLYGLTESGARKYQNTVDNIKKAIAQAEGK